MNDSAHHDHTTAGQPDDSAELLGPALARLRQADPERWQAPIKPLLGVLLAARAPLDLDALGDILEVDSAALVAALDDLDGIVVNDQAAGYRLARLQPAPDQPGPPPPAFVLAPDDLRAGHRRLAAWCAEAEIWRDSADPAGHNLASQIKGYPEGTWVLLARCGRLREAVDSLELASLENDVLKVFSEWCGLAGWATETSPAAAAPFLERARLLSSTIEDPYRALYLVDVAGGYRAAGQPELGERLLDEALALAHAHQHESRTAHQLSGIARELAERGRIAAALDTAAAIPDLGERAKICCELAALIDQRGDGQAAAALLEMALLAAPSIDGTWKGAEAWGAIAGYWAGAGDFARAQAAAASIKDPKSQAAALLALARTSDAQTALSMLDQALTLASGIDDDEIRIPLRLGIAAQLQDCGAPEAAEALIEEALAF
ncbi:MAG TPA: hypothetical protein VD886_26720, partial [Herpetosiphonaceae bacterium]|nr:hypothetical protein [Herpetosiphonaceae bacterium]